MPQCAVASCNNTWKNKRKFVSFHKFPGNTKLARKWLEACKLKHLTHIKQLKSWHTICSMHFTAECFNCHLSNDTVKLTLKPGACPTINVPKLGKRIWHPVSYENHIGKLLPVQEFLRMKQENESGSLLTEPGVCNSKNDGKSGSTDNVDSVVNRLECMAAANGGCEVVSASISRGQDKQEDRSVLCPGGRNSRKGSAKGDRVSRGGANTRKKKTTIGPHKCFSSYKDDASYGIIGSSSEMTGISAQVGSCGVSKAAGVVKEGDTFLVLVPKGNGPLAGSCVHNTMESSYSPAGERSHNNNNKISSDVHTIDDPKNSESFLNVTAIKTKSDVQEDTTMESTGRGQPIPNKNISKVVKNSFYNTDNTTPEILGSYLNITSNQSKYSLVDTEDFPKTFKSFLNVHKKKSRSSQAGSRRLLPKVSSAAVGAVGRPMTILPAGVVGSSLNVPCNSVFSINGRLFYVPCVAACSQDSGSSLGASLCSIPDADSTSHSSAVNNNNIPKNEIIFDGVSDPVSKDKLSVSRSSNPIGAVSQTVPHSVAKKSSSSDAVGHNVSESRLPSDLVTTNSPRDCEGGIAKIDGGGGQGNRVSLGCNGCEDAASFCRRTNKDKLCQFAQHCRTKYMKCNSQLRLAQRQLRIAKAKIKEQRAYVSAASLFTPAQLKRISNPLSKSPWDEESMVKAVALRSISCRAHGFVSSVLKYPLPSSSCVGRLLKGGSDGGILAKSQALLREAGLIKAKAKDMTKAQLKGSPEKEDDEAVTDQQKKNSGSNICIEHQNQMQEI